jgi:hypothetical protein
MLENIDMNNIKDVAKLVYDQMYKYNKNNLLDAYSYIKHLYHISFSYEEIKDYLFHHDLSIED